MQLLSDFYGLKARPNQTEISNENNVYLKKMSKNKKQTIENLSKIFKLTLICALIMGIIPANAQTDKLLIANFKLK